MELSGIKLFVPKIKYNVNEQAASLKKRFESVGITDWNASFKGICEMCPKRCKASEPCASLIIIGLIASNSLFSKENANEHNKQLRDATKILFEKGCDPEIISWHPSDKYL